MPTKNIAVSDPIADMLTRIRNANERYKARVTMPASRLKEAIAQILVDEGYIESCERHEVDGHGELSLTLKYKGKRGRVRVIRGLERVSRPSRRVYASADEIPAVMGGLGTAILSTSRGVVTGKQARRERIGGEVLARIW